MRNRIAFVVLTILISGTSFPSQAAYNATKPSVTRCSSNTNSISDSGGLLQLTLHIVDPTPVNLAVINVMNSEGNNIAFGNLNLQSGTNTDGDWGNTFTVKPNLKPGTYSVVAQHVMDESQNDLLFYSCPGLTISYGSAPTQSQATPAPNAAPQNPEMSAAQQALAAAKYAFCIAQNSVAESAAKITGATSPLAADCGIDPAKATPAPQKSEVSTPNNAATDLIAAYDSVNAKLSAFKDWVLQIKSLYPNHVVAIDMYTAAVFKFPQVSSITSAETLANLIASQQTLIENSVKQWEKTVSVKTVINCSKGKLTKKVTGINPKCPTGYSIKK